MTTEFGFALLGGALIGLAASLHYLAQGRIAGASGILGAALRRPLADGGVRVSFLLGLGLVGLVARLAAPEALADADTPLGVTVAAGLLVGFGTRLSGGCTSGHGVCGVARLSSRSLVATLTFMSTAALTVWITHHLLGGAQ